MGFLGFTVFRMETRRTFFRDLTEAGFADSLDFCWTHTQNTRGAGGELTEVFPPEALTPALVTHPAVIFETQLTDMGDLQLL